MASTNEPIVGRLAFSKLAKLIERISKTSGNEAKKRIVNTFLTECRTNIYQVHQTEPASTSSSAITDSLFPIIRLLIPQCDKARHAYGIKEHKLAKLYIKLLGLGEADKQLLLNFKSPKHAGKSAGDFAQVVYTVVKNRCPEYGSLTVKDVNDILTNIAVFYSTNKNEQIKTQLQRLLTKTSALEQKWLVRILMKEVKSGLSQTSILSILHPDAEALYDVSQDLNKICQDLQDATKRLPKSQLSIALFVPFKPMLADRGDPGRIDQQANSLDLIVEVKWDGERVQLHKEGDLYRYWSRNGNEWTTTYGSNPSEMNLTCYLHSAFKPEVRSVILDGEMMGYNHITNTVGPKSEGLDIKSSSTLDTKGYEPFFLAFDIVFYNGKSVMEKSTVERKRLLDSILTRPIQGRLQVAEWHSVTGRQPCIDKFNDAIDKREEGIMVKKADSPYTVATRKGGWFKLKPDYVLGLHDELDLIILGGYFGSGSWSGMIGMFLLGVVADKGDEDKGDEPTEFLSFCKVASGYSKQALCEYNKKMAPHWKPFNVKYPPSFLSLAPPLKERPDVFVEPKNSMLVQVKAAEIVASSSFKTGCTLRFPRVECFRPDKSWTECMTLSEVKQMRSQHEGKLTSRHVTVSESECSGDEGPSPAKKRRPGNTRAPAPRPVVMARCKAGVDPTKLTKVSQLLKDKEICIIHSETEAKTQLERTIVENGGVIAQNPGRHTFCVLADKINLKVRNLIRSSNYDVVNPDWLMRCIDAGQLLPWKPKDLLHASEKTATELASEFDEYGDTFTDEITAKELKTIFDRIDEKKIKVPHLNHGERSSFLEETWPAGDHDMGFLHMCSVYLNDCLVLGQGDTRLPDWATGGLHTLGVDLIRLGAKLSQNPSSEDVTHAVISRKFCESSRLDELRQLNRSRKRKFYVVWSDWALDSIRDGEWKNEKSYLV